MIDIHCDEKRQQNQYVETEAKKNPRNTKKRLDIRATGAIMTVAFLRGLEKAPTFLVPIINPPFADNSPHSSGVLCTG
jgi:hypothetical protein